MTANDVHARDVEALPTELRALAARRLSSLVVVGAALLGLLAALATESWGLSTDLAISVGLGVFVAASMGGVLVARRRDDPTSNGRWSSSQLGADSEQELSRGTGART